MGGTEKISEGKNLDFLRFPYVLEKDPEIGIKRGLLEFKPDVVIDLSDEPIVGYRERLKYASIVLSSGVSYVGADFKFEAPVYHKVSKKPSIALIGTGKRVGKTAVSAYACRVLKNEGFSPCVVAMGRGGPDEPEVIRGGEIELTPDFLLSLSHEGKHAASDHYEDAMMSRITTVGCRRCGGGLVGMPFVSNVLRGAEIANELDEDFVIFEGSGATIPPIATDKCLVTVGAHQPVDYVVGYFGTYRLLISHLVVLTMCEKPMADGRKVELLDKEIRRINPSLKVIWTIFRPKPLKDIAGEKVFLTTTASKLMRETLKGYLEENYGCEVVGISNELSNRLLLRKDLAEHEGKFTLLLTELKAASVDVVTEEGLRLRKEVVYMDNEPITVGGDGELSSLIIELALQAKNVFIKGEC